jgi:hypothetical protein
MFVSVRPLGNQEMGLVANLAGGGDTVVRFLKVEVIGFS